MVFDLFGDDDTDDLAAAAREAHEAHEANEKGAHGAGRCVAARVRFRTALVRAPDDPETRREYADLLDRLVQDEAARDRYARADAIDSAGDDGP